MKSNRAGKVLWFLLMAVLMVALVLGSAANVWPMLD